MDQSNNLPTPATTSRPLPAETASPESVRLAALLPQSPTVRRRVFGSLLRTIISGGEL